MVIHSLIQHLIRILRAVGDPDMADSSGDTNNESGTAPQQSRGGVSAIIIHMQNNRIEAALWLSRLVTLFFTISYLLPIFGFSQYSSGQKVLIAGGLTSALRLHQRMPQFALNREFLATVFKEDSAHYLLYSVIILFAAQPSTMTLLPVFLFALLHSTVYTKDVLDILGPNSLQMIRNLLNKVNENQRAILRLIATMEITLMPSTLFMILSGQAALFLPFFYYRFLCLRYLSTRNPYSRTIFYELRIMAEHMSRHERCPAFASSLIQKCIEFTCRLSPVVPQ